MAAWFSKKPRIAPVKPEEVDTLRQQPSRMQGLWAKCEECNEIIYRAEIEGVVVYGRRLPASTKPSPARDERHRLGTETP